MLQEKINRSTYTVYNEKMDLDMNIEIATVFVLDYTSGVTQKNRRMFVHFFIYNVTDEQLYFANISIDKNFEFLQTLEKTNAERQLKIEAIYEHYRELVDKLFIEHFNDCNNDNF